MIDAFSTSGESDSYDIRLEFSSGVAHNVKWYGIIGIGQSLGSGYQADLNEDTQPVAGGFRLRDSADKFDMTNPLSDTLSLVPLTEPFRLKTPETDGSYPKNIAGMTPHSAMAAQITALNSQNGNYQPLNTVHSCCAEGGREMSAIKKNGSGKCYAGSIFEAKAITRLARLSGHDLTYDAVILTHGETDAGLANEHYDAELIELHKNYCEDLMAITGQDNKPVMILSQQQTCPAQHNVECKVIQDQWKVEGHIICSGPKYQYGYAPMNLHLPIGGYNRLGEKYGQVFYDTVVQGRPFVPLSPRQVTRRSLRTIIVALHVPYPPLVWDEHLPKPHQKHNAAWSAGRGFEVSTTQGKQVEIESVTIEPDGCSVAITLGSGHDTSPLRVGYAMTGDIDANFMHFFGGCAEGRIGHLCDSDPLVGAFSETLPCQMMHGLKEFSYASNTLQRRGKYDVVNGGDAVLLDFDETRGTLDKPWTGTTGEHSLTFHHNQKNFLVSFYGMSVE